MTVRPDGIPIEILKANGRINSFTISASTRKLDFDTSTLERLAISELVKEFIKKNGSKSSMKPAMNDLIGLAVGYYDVSIKELYPDLTDVYELDDNVLGAIFRWKGKREDDRG